MLPGLFLHLQRVDLLAVDPAQEQGRQAYGEQLRNGEGPPDDGQPTDAGQKESDRQQYHQLTHDRYHQAEHAVAQSLEYGGAYH